MHENVPIPATAGAALASRVDELSALYRLTDRLYRARSLADVYDAALDAIVTLRDAAVPPFCCSTRPV
jgi:hypothetical protein